MAAKKKSKATPKRASTKEAAPKRRTTASKANAKKTATKKANTGAPTPGTKIERTFKGKTITVQVTDEGFRYGGKTYRSLTALALHITGYKAVSGPRFFGLVEPKVKGGAE